MPVKKVLAICFMAIPIYCAHAQEQERKLVDRIMKPDMTLENDAQKKKFTADRTSVKKQAPVSTFYMEKKSPAKTYSGTRDFSADQYNAKQFDQTKEGATDHLAGKTASTNDYSDGSKTSATHPAHDQNNSQPTRNYAGNRPYLEKGKSQKFLKQKNKPMTIEQVRELLNKNK